MDDPQTVGFMAKPATFHGHGSPQTLCWVKGVGLLSVGGFLVAVNTKMSVVTMLMVDPGRCVRGRLVNRSHIDPGQ